MNTLILPSIREKSIRFILRQQHCHPKKDILSRSCTFCCHCKYFFFASLITSPAANVLVCRCKMRNAHEIFHVPSNTSFSFDNNWQFGGIYNLAFSQEMKTSIIKSRNDLFFLYLVKERRFIPSYIFRLVGSKNPIKNDKLGLIFLTLRYKKE